ncbi:Ig-like domain-containing protein [Agromyces italicus]|uniref:Ig-like domain-containing protein n=1 Tax=Agromyces italicus TaxID=279572 RepID=UPI0003B73434|nr:Ig-like domain-containing protein [Agromyces italicus]
MGTFASWIRTRKATATTLALTLLAGVPLTFAVLHQGFPVTDPDLRARDVWVTNAKDLLAGRLNRPIGELDAAVSTATNEFDVLQNGDDAFLYDRSIGSIERIDPSFTTLTERIDVPPGSTVAYGGEVLAVLSPKGELWTVLAGSALSFDAAGTDPLLKLGEGAQVAVSGEGTVFATKPGKGALYTIALDHEPVKREVPKLAGHQLTAVGERAVILDEKKNRVIVDGKAVELPAPGLRLQQSGAEHDTVLVAGADALFDVPLGGGAVTSTPNGGDTPAAKASEVAAPVWLEGCAHGAWSASARYLAACDGAEPRSQAIEQRTAGARLEFRVNRDVIVLNNLSNGNAWLVDSDLRLVDNWEEVTPPEESEDEEGDEKSSQQNFEDTLAERGPINRPPLARDDEYGVRPERTTILEVLENDTDPDGDVLTVAELPAASGAAGRLELIDGGRALQFTPEKGAAGTASFRYTVDDGRGGKAEASVNVRVRPPSENEAPISMRNGATSVEQSRQISYNVLADWNDPDGDDVYLVNASPTSGDSVRFSPDGLVTFAHQSGELGAKEVQYIVSDGQTEAAGTLTVEVKPTGTLNPVGTPDFAQVFAGESVSIEPLANDLTPSGAPLTLVGLDEVPEGPSITPNLERGTVTFSANEPGEYVFLYNLAADTAVSVGLIRVQVNEAPGEAPPPIAVKDTAYLRPGEPTTVPLLANDVSPSGRVLAVQSVDDSATDDLVSVEILTNTVARVTASEAIDRQLQFTYTISDGVNTATASVAVVPVPPLVKHQPPVAADDSVNVRAGDIVTVPVLDNDYHPDAAAIHVLPELANTNAEGGLAFVSEDAVRFQAPKAPGTYSTVYTVGDDFEQTARATVRFTVIGPDPENNRAPLPTPLTSRTFEGSAVKIDVPLDGIDPDGDSVVLTGISTPPALGRIIERTSTSITYEALTGSAGTDTFKYEVQDTGGAKATGVVRIGVIPRPAVQLPPKAVDDTIEMKPGRTVGVEVLLNDSDPSGYQLHVAGLPDVDDGIEAEVRDRRRVVVTAPETEGAYTLRYEISNGHGGADAAFLQIAVSKDAKILPPTAEDQVIEPEEVVDGDRVNVRPLNDATNPGGLVEDLSVTVEGPNADRAEVLNDGSIDVKPGRERFAVAFRLENELDELDAKAFVIVPPIPGGEEPVEETQRPKTPEELAAEEKAKFPAPHLAELGEIVVPMNGSITWNVNDIVVVPSGKPPLILTASATNAGESPFVDGQTLQYVPEQDYRGSAAVTFEVTDGTSADDPIGRKAVLTIPITVGDPNFNDTPPTFTPRNETIQAGEEPWQVDLRSSTFQPNPDNIERVEYTNLGGTTDDIQASIDGGTLTMSAELGVQPGTSTRLTFDLRFESFTVPGYVDVKVVSSTRAEPTANDDGPIDMTRSDSQPVDVLANDFNPFNAEGEKLRVVAAEIDSLNVGSNATVSHTETGITVRTGPAFTGELSVIYRIGDATMDPAREVQGRVKVIVRDEPDAPTLTRLVEGDGYVDLTWRGNATNNSPIEEYIVSYAGKQARFGANADGSPQRIPNLANGTSYSFTVRAINEIGPSEASNSMSGVPYGAPSVPRSVSLTASQNGNGNLSMSWAAPSDNGGRAVTRYDWAYREGGSATGQTGATSASANGSNGTTYRYDVRACNARGCSPWATSNRATPTKPPPPEPSGTIGKGASMACDSGGGGCARVRISWNNLNPGNYRVYAMAGGSGVGSYRGVYNGLGSSGRLELQNHLGQRNDTIAVRFENISGGTSVTLGSISGAQWNNLGYNTW